MPNLAGLGILLPAAAVDFFGLVAGMAGSYIRWKYQPVAAEEGEGDAGSFELASRLGDVKLSTSLWGLITRCSDADEKDSETRCGVLPCGLLTIGWV